MSPSVVAAESTELFVGRRDAPRQVVRVTVAGASAGCLVSVRGPGLDTPEAAEAAGDGVVEVGVLVAGHAPGDTLAALAVVEAGAERATAEFTLTVAEPGWTMHLVNHFHYDPVWWNTQAAYTSRWDEVDFAGSPRGARQLAGFDLVRAHLDLALADEDYRFVLAEVDYLKPYWDSHPADRAVLRRLLAEGRVEIMGGAYNEPNTNLTHPETTIRNFVHGNGFQRHVLGSDPATAWQLDVFGHDPAFPGLAADAGLTSSSWARGPFHQWGPMDNGGDPTRMQFDSEFEWLSPSGRGLLTSYMTGHYSAGWRLDSAGSLADAERGALELFQGLKKVATTRHVLLPVGTDYAPPNKWVTAIHHDWNSRYVWPRFVCSLPRDFFAGVRADLAERGQQPSPQTRDMNPIYTGKDVSYIDTKQAHRAAEHALLDAEKFAVFANLLTGARYPDAAFAKAWVQLAYGAHHDGITGSESDQVYVDLLAGWREAYELGTTGRNGALAALTSIVDTAGGERPVVVWNPLTVERSGMVTVRCGPVPVQVVDEAGERLPAVAENGSVTFRADRVPSLGWRTFWLRPTEDVTRWHDTGGGTAIANEHYELTVDAARGGGVSSLVERASGRQLIADGRVGNELAVYEEYSQHPGFGEGPWHLLPKGPVRTSAARPATVRVLRSAVGERIEARGAVGPVRYTQTITLWHGVDRVECATRVEDFTGADQLLRVRWPCPVRGALPVSEVGNAVVGRGFGLIDVDSGRHPWTLDNPAHTWFGLSAAASVAVGGTRRAIGVAEIVVPDRTTAGPLVRGLVVALARCGVTATVSGAAGPRYGNLAVDSNLPDVRISVGGPEENSFTAEVLDSVDGDGSLRKRLARQESVVRWIEPTRPLAEVWVPGADLRDAGMLPVLLIGGTDLASAVEAVVADLADHVIAAESSMDTEDPLAGARISAEGLGQVGYEDRTVALCNRGFPGFAVDVEGTLHASLLRSCTGWPSGTWINPPRRTVPDGSNFQQQHWTHEFDYAIASGRGDWRAAGVGRSSAEFSHPLLPVLPNGSAAASTLPSRGSLLRIEPADAVTLGALKAAGNPLTRGSAEPAEPALAVALRLAATGGRAVTAVVSSPVLRFADAAGADLLERRGDPLPDADEVAVPLCAFETSTVLARPELTVESTVDERALAPEAEPAQPLYARYWLHNRGPAPLGGLPVSVRLEPMTAAVEPGGRLWLDATVVSDRTDGELHGRLRLRLPPGWLAEPDELPFGLPAGGHVTSKVLVVAPRVVADGSHPVRAQVELVGEGLPPSWRQVVEDVAVLVLPDDDSGPFGLDLIGTSEEGAEALMWIRDQPAAVRVAAGDSAELAVTVATPAHAPVAVEAQLISPWGTWGFAGPWSIGAELPARGHARLSFLVAPPHGTPPGRWWALVKVIGAGRLLYSETVSVEVTR
ncbi:alpha-mannosidase [Solihabitans fulvus]|uniref:Alpha-mannosidase n=1 Tax=Solihabitans fulvus TaxID=1892852 RepID=A0A5B2XL35_9PSEU|nr:NEW3 domain-containing protein [Solihabitans fulvus]KAA2263472.1 alpha-mannosidase [Solihabitans fulvus]